MRFFNAFKSITGFVKLGHYISQVYVRIDELEVNLTNGNFNVNEIDSQIIEIAHYSKQIIGDPISQYDYNPNSLIALDNLQNKVSLTFALHQTIGRLIAIADSTDNTDEVSSIFQF